MKKQKRKKGAKKNILEPSFVGTAKWFPAIQIF